MPSEVIDHGFIKSIHTFDPNGIPVEFSVDVEGVDVRSEPRMADREPTQLAAEGTEPQPGRWPEPDEKPPAGERRVYPGAGSELFHGKK